MARKTKLIIVDANFPYGIVQRVAAQATVSNVMIDMQADTLKADGGISYDFTNFWFVIPLTGVYTINGFFQWAAHADVLGRTAQIFINGAVAFTRAELNNNFNGGNNISITALELLNAGDTVQFKVRQNSGIGINSAIVGRMSQFSLLGHLTQ